MLNPLLSSLHWDDGRLEDVHDYIQWLFPLPERSGANPWAPVLTAEDIAAFHEHGAIRERLLAAFQRMMLFYGLVAREGRVERGPKFAEHARSWLHPGNHNHLRITRMLRSLRLLGLEDDAAAFWRFLEQLYRDEPDAITERTFGFWQRAAEGPIPSAKNG